MVETEGNDCHCVHAPSGYCGGPPLGRTPGRDVASAGEGNAETVGQGVREAQEAGQGCDQRCACPGEPGPLRVMQDGLLRRSDAAALWWGDVEDGLGWLHAVRSKTGVRGSSALPGPGGRGGPAGHPAPGGSHQPGRQRLRAVGQPRRCVHVCLLLLLLPTGPARRPSTPAGGPASCRPRCRWRPGRRSPWSPAG